MPHRMAYIKGGGETHGQGAKTGARPEDSCPFCRAPGLPDDEGLVVARGELIYTVLNLYPYNGGHVMVCPYRHVADYTELDEAETVELARYTQKAMRVIRSVRSTVRTTPSVTTATAPSWPKCKPRIFTPLGGI